MLETKLFSIFDEEMRIYVVKYEVNSSEFNAFWKKEPGEKKIEREEEMEVGEENENLILINDSYIITRRQAPVFFSCPNFHIL